MAPTARFKDGSLPSQAALEKIISYFNRVTPPVYLGFISMELGVSIAAAEWMIEALVDQKRVRALTPAEKRNLLINEICSVYVLV